MDGNTEDNGNDSNAPKHKEAALLVAARAYTRRGWRVVPLLAGEKTPAVAGWTHLWLPEHELPRWFGGGLRARNLGLLTGAPSGGLVDVDCDAPEAAAAAALLLPPTGRISGRGGSPASHYWYVISDEALPATARYAYSGLAARGTEVPAQGDEGPKPATVAPREGLQSGVRAAAVDCREPVHQTMLIELRATGCQTLAPPSRHPSGEIVRWERAEEPGRVTADDLLRAVAQVAAAALLARHWPGVGSRDEAACALAGVLLRGGWQPEQADHFAQVVARIAGDEEWAKRGKAEQTARKLAAGAAVTGAHRLATLLSGDEGGAGAGTRIVEQVRTWLGLAQYPPPLGSASLGSLAGVHAPTPGPSPVRGRGEPEGREGASYSESAQADFAAASDHPGANSFAGPPPVGALDTGLSGSNEDEIPRGGTLVSQVREEAIRWLWPGRIPLGKLTLLDGDPGLGKSLVTLDLVARLTTGRAMPDVEAPTPNPSPVRGRGGTASAPVAPVANGAAVHGLRPSGPPLPPAGEGLGVGASDPIEGGVVLLSAEDDLAATIRPRLVAACADLTRIFVLQTVSGWDFDSGQAYERGILLPADSAEVARAIAYVGAKLVVIDPLMAYLDGRVNSWRDQDVRAALAPLARLAEQTGAAILVLRHLTKGGGSNALYRGGGSIGIIGAARSGLLVAKHPERPEEERVLASSKSNLGPPMPALGYRILATQDARGTSIPRIEWLGATSYTAASLLAAADRIGTEGVGEPSRLEEACAFLRETLAEGPRPAAEVERLARGYGISDHTLRRARRELSVTAQHDGRSGQWAITLPPTALF